MIAARVIEVLICLSALLAAYLITETLSGAFRAWLSQALGDPTAAYEGLLTLNPIAHIDPIGIILLFLVGFGWGRSIPLDFSFIQEPYRRLKCILISFSDAFSHLCIALFALVALLTTFDLDALYLATPMILSGNISLSAFAIHYPTHSSFALVVAIILVAIIYLSILLTVLKFIMSSCRLGMIYFFEEDYNAVAQSSWSIILPMALIFLFSHYLRLYAVYGLFHLGHFIATLLGSL